MQGILHPPIASGVVLPFEHLMRDGSGLVFSHTKNSNHRTIRLTPTAAEALRRHRARQAEEKLGAGSLYNSPPLS
jgi:hypothetical protein